MPAFSARYRRIDAPSTPAAPAARPTIDRKVSRTSTAKATRVSRPSRAKTVEGVPRKEPSDG